MIEEKDTELLITIDVNDPLNAMLPWCFLYFISRWAKRHEQVMKADVKVEGGTAMISIKEWSLYFEEALHSFTNAMSNGDCDIFTVHYCEDDGEDDEEDDEDEWDDVIEEELYSEEDYEEEE